MRFPASQSAREKSIRHRHPSTLHLWWARWMPGRAPSREAFKAQLEALGVWDVRIQAWTIDYDLVWGIKIAEWDEGSPGQAREE